ncbi:hypothetical protein BVX98_04155 [bacterium F11]|nr:hypothetical protein BVX98_04155 [bacterium F11]
MKILLTHNVYRETGGEEKGIERMAFDLKARGHQVEFFREFSQDWGKKGIASKLRTGLQIVYSWDNLKKITTICREYQPDFIHVHNLFPFLTPSVCSVGKQMGIPIVQTLHNFRLFCLNGLLYREGNVCELCLKGSLLNGTVHRCYQQGFITSGAMSLTLCLHRMLNTWNSKIDRFIALSEFSRNKFVENGIANEKIEVIPNGIDLSGDCATDEIPSSPSLVYIGRLSEEKGIRTLLKAFAIFSTKRPDVPLHVVGTGRLEREVRNFKEENSNLKIFLHGYLQAYDRDQLLKKSTFLMFPSECYENCPYVILESLSLGIPVIGSDRGGIPELINDGTTGYLFESGSPSQLNAVLVKAMENLSQWPSMTRNAREEAKARFDKKVWIERIENLYKSILKSRNSELIANLD